MTTTSAFMQAPALRTTTSQGRWPPPLEPLPTAWPLPSTWLCNLQLRARREIARATPKNFFARCARGQAHSVPIEPRRSYDGAWRTLDDILAPHEMQTEVRGQCCASMMPYIPRTLLAMTMALLW